VYAAFNVKHPETATLLERWHQQRERWARPSRLKTFNLGVRASSCAEAIDSTSLLRQEALAAEQEVKKKKD